MTRSLYFARSEIKTRHKPVAHYMTQSVMVTPKTVKVAALNRTPGIFIQMFFVLFVSAFTQHYIGEVELPKAVLSSTF